MVYIVVLNWNGWRDTIACLESLVKLDYKSFKIIVCDNDSSDDSIEMINNWYYSNKQSCSYLSDSEYQVLNNDDIGKYKSESHRAVYLIQTGKNLGYAGGNNVGLKFAMNQRDMNFVWVLNNDTEVQCHSLQVLVDQCEMDKDVGVCGSKMVYHHDRSKIQGLGGIYNKYLATTKHFAGNESADKKFDDDSVSKNIDYVIGASIFFPRNTLDTVGLMCEDYFLYYEELDYCLRVKANNLKVKVVTESIVFHKEGATIKKYVSDFSDFLQVKNRLIITRKFGVAYYPIVWLSIFGVFFIRCMRGKFRQSLRIFKIICLREKSQFL